MIPLVGLIRHLQRTYNISAIVVTHDLSCAFKVADRIMLLYDGKIMISGPVEEVKKSDNPYFKQFLKAIKE
ncbi:hypothetical protein DMNBHIDG_03137 [Candidatus Methanoperedenaceae archaeon GB37]|nr:hypothetical protein DMNBHIDG_03137 [Candidatus Methanoperedenaceae archaeon GB37]